MFAENGSRFIVILVFQLVFFFFFEKKSVFIRRKC